MSTFEVPGEPPIVDSFSSTRDWIVWYVVKTGVAPGEALNEWEYRLNVKLSALATRYATECRTPHDPAKALVKCPESGPVYEDLINRLKG